VFETLLDASIAANRAATAPVTVTLEGAFEHAAVLGRFANITGLVCVQPWPVHQQEASLASSD
jgi:hypothetical protein